MHKTCRVEVDNGLIIQGKASHAVHFGFIGNKCPNGGRTKSSEKEEQGYDIEPLYAFYRLQQIFIHSLFIFISGVGNFDVGT